MKSIHSIYGLLGLAVVAISPAWAAPQVFIPLGSGNGVIEVDAATDKVINHFTGVDNPHGLVATPDGEYLIAGSLYEDNQKKAQGEKLNSQLFLVHPAHGHVMQTIPVEGWSHHQAMTPDGRFVLSTHPTRNQLSVVDITTATQVRTIETGQAPYYVVVTRDGLFAYVSNSGSASIQEIDLKNWQVTRTINAGPSPEHMVLSQDDQTLYVNNTRSGTLSAIPRADPDARKEYPIGAKLHGLDISDDGRWLFITSRADSRLIALDPANDVRRTLSLSPDPYHLNTITGSGKLYVSSRSKPTIWVVDQQSLNLLGTIALPAGEGHQMAIVQ